MVESRQFVNSDKGKDIFYRLRDVIVENGMLDEMDPLNEIYLTDALGALLVTNPINTNTPFKVNWDENVPIGLEGQRFEVENVKIVPSARSYSVKLTAQYDDSKYLYQFAGRIANNEPFIVVDTAVVTDVQDRRFRLEETQLTDLSEKKE